MQLKYSNIVAYASSICPSICLIFTNIMPVNDEERRPCEDVVINSTAALQPNLNHSNRKKKEKREAAQSRATPLTVLQCDFIWYSNI